MAALASTFPIATRQAERDIAGFPTEILLQFFQDRTMVYVNQGKIGKILQISPPTSNRRRATQRRDPFNDDAEEDDSQSNTQATATSHPSLEGTFLPPPDASSAVTTLFGTSKSEEVRQLEHLYASQIAAILFAKAKNPDNDDDTTPLLREVKPVIVALGLKAAFVEGQASGKEHGPASDNDNAMSEQRARFRDVMELVSGVL